METINLRDEVARAIRTEWPNFAAEHPNLAAALDQTLIIEQAVQELGADPEYQQAMQTAAAAGTLAETLGGLVSRYIGPWLRRLV